MFFHYKKSASGETLQLLEGYRTQSAKTPRHRVVVSLGDLPVRTEWLKPLAELITRRVRGELGIPETSLPPEALAVADEIILRIERRNREEPELLPVADQPPAAAVIEPGSPAATLEPAGQAAPPAEKTVNGVLVDRVEHSHDTTLGPLLCALRAWDVLGMPGMLQRLGFNPAQQQAAAALVISRLLEPMSENAFVNWLPHSSLPDLLGPEVLRGGTDRYYRVGDRLFENANTIEKHLRERVRRHFGFNRAIMLYDLTNFHFEGSSESNPKARRGKNKQKRNDCPQVVLGVVFDEYGFVLAHSIFAGNTGDAKTLPEMVTEMQRLNADNGQLDLIKPTVIMDGGLASEANKKLLRASGFHYLVNDKRGTRADWRNDFAETGFEPIPGREPGQAVLVRCLELPAEDERVLLCKSAGRREKELAIRSRAEMRLREDLEKLAKRLEAGKLADEKKAIQALGRFRERHSRVARYYEMQIENNTGQLSLRWSRNDEQWQDASALAGNYVLRTSRTDLSGPELWSLYMSLCQAEEGFRLVKGELGLRPNYHQVEDRVDAHTFITILAYQLLRFILYSLEQTGDHRQWAVLRRVLLTHCYATLHLPTVDGRVYRVRKPGMPEACQWEIYRALGITSLAGLPVAKDVLSPAPGGEKSVVTQKSDA